MVTAREQFAADILAALPDLPGFQPAVYRPKEGAPVDTYVMVESKQRESERLARGVYAEIRIPIQAVAEPEIDDILIIDGESWTVRPSTDQFVQMREAWPFWIVRCRKDLRPVPGAGR